MLTLTGTSDGGSILIPGSGAAFSESLSLSPMLSSESLEKWKLVTGDTFDSSLNLGPIEKIGQTPHNVLKTRYVYEPAGIVGGDVL